MTVALLIASNGFQETEYRQTKEAVLDAGFLIKTVSDGPIAVSHHGNEQVVDEYLSDLDVRTVDGVFLIGGKGAMTHLDNQETNRIVNEAMLLQKAYGGICITPRILAKANVLINKKATGWNGDGELESLFVHNHVVYVPDLVVTDGLIVTASAPESAREFGEAIVRVLKK